MTILPYALEPGPGAKIGSALAPGSGSVAISGILNVTDATAHTMYASTWTLNNGGNPKLRPWKANAYDLSWEKYFGENQGYVSLAAYYKDLTTFIVQEGFLFDFTGFELPVAISSRRLKPRSPRVGFRKFFMPTASAIAGPDRLNGPIRLWRWAR